MPDARARTTLIAALAAVALAAMPNLFGIPSGAVSPAFADDHRDDDDDDDDDDDGGGGRRARAGGGAGSDDGRARVRGEGPYLLEMLFGDEGGPRRARTRRSAPPPPLAASDEVVIDGVTPPALDRLVAAGFEVLASAPIDPARRVVRLRVPLGVSVDDALARVEAIDSTMTGGRNHYYRAQQDAETGTYEGACTADICRDWTRIGWRPGFGGSCLMATTIGIVDTGINADHEALAGARLEIITLGGGEAPSERKHGTAVVALLAGLPASRVPGLVPAARVIAADPFTRIGGDERADAFGVVASLEALAASGSRVINLSLAGPENQVLANAVRRRVEAGTVLVAAVGNAGPRAAPQYPAAYPGVIGVTAVDRNDRVWRRAVQGAHVDFAAPGVGVSTAASIRGLRPQSGTSFAAPFVTAAAAVLLSADPTLNPDAVASRLAASALDLGEPGRDPVYGNGLVQAVGECGTPVAEEVLPAAPGG